MTKSVCFLPVSEQTSVPVQMSVPVFVPVPVQMLTSVPVSVSLHLFVFAVCMLASVLMLIDETAPKCVIGQHQEWI